ncbi:hypothetical protein HIM_08629 [Hirsutella minnesotensis 3608]|uniref:2EXR domain-containing protein n=1 Tax=Hirsutella minnesotensis 3608 TaxID=1043627 RepID=A0A0F8A3J7_9HYPO|nr:hypothetical protein HIM_08629 [Hirsutella minnesotensis 3608]
MSTGAFFWTPTEFRQFTLFPRLPPEIRQNIWLDYICNPGINFIRLRVLDGSRRLGQPLLRPISNTNSDPKRMSVKTNGKKLEKLDESDLLVIKDDFKPMRSLVAKIEPQSPVWMGDLSEYKSLRQRLKVLRSTCVETAALVKSMLNRSGVFRLTDRTVVTLSKSDDLVCLEYLQYEDYSRNCPLNVKLICSGLENVRRLAMSFCHEWRPAVKYDPCSTCGKICHNSSGKPNAPVDEGNYPTHLYQFLARYLPNLEEFYFLDYYIVPKPPSDILGKHTARIKEQAPLRYFRTKDRILFEFCETEAYAREWKISRNAVEIKNWLRDHFVRYAKASHLSRHKTPEKVHFGILACEWDVSPPPVRKSPTLKATCTTRLDKGMSTLGSAKPAARAQSLVPSNRQGMRPGGPSAYVFGSAPQHDFNFQFSFSKTLDNMPRF